MPIFRTTLSSDFAQISNAFADTPMKFQAKALLLHLLVKPPEWCVNKSAIAKTLDLSIYIVKKSLAWLRKHGYAIYQHAKDGFGQWFIYDTPQLKTTTAPVKCPKSAIPTLALEPTLVINKVTIKHKEQQTSAAAPTASQNIVVVIDKEQQDELIYPKQLDTAQKKDVKRIITKLKQPELSQPILLELAYIITTGKLKTTIPRCLGGLVSTANEQGHFTYSQACNSTIPDTKRIDDTPAILDAYRGDTYRSEAYSKALKINPEKKEAFTQQIKSALRGAL